MSTDHSSMPVLVPRTEIQRRSRDYHLEEWSSGTRGGGKVPADFSWRTNPKQWQEELGSGKPRQGPR